MVVPPSPLSSDSDLVTVEEFYCLVPDGQKADLIDEVVFTWPHLIPDAAIDWVVLSSF